MKIRKLAAALTVLVLLCSGTAQGEGKKTMFEKEWYLQALKDSVMSTGNNARLKKVIDRARGGEEITLATIGGSITEGAGAAVYQKCWAVRFSARFRARSPYLSSPRIGCPICARWARIWCVLPVTR